MDSTATRGTWPAREADAHVVTTFCLRDVEGQWSVRYHLSGRYGVTVFSGDEEFRVSVGHRVEDLGHVVQLVRQIQPDAVVRSCL